MDEEDKPGWLQTLWNVNPRLAEEAERELTMLYAIKKSALETAEFIKTLK